MIRHTLLFPSGWEWHVLQQSGASAQPQEPLPSRKNSARSNQSPDHPLQFSLVRPQSRTDEPDDSPQRRLDELKRQFPACANWIEECGTRRTNHILVDRSEDTGPILCGTLMIQISEDASDIVPFHFWLSRHRIMTLYDDLRLPLRLQNGSHITKYEECELAPEAFFTMISVLLETFHSGLDGFERRLGELERTMRHRNRTDLLDVIFDRRYDLLHWSHLFIPIREVHGAAKEAFADELMEKDAFKRITHKLERIDALLKHYALEIDTLISMDDAISSFRGNDIMKTLTIFTVLFLPATVIPAIWGMNFDWLPWTRQDWGFALSLSGTGVITAGIYLWLWRKGWTGDLLVRRREKMRLPDSDDKSGSHRRRTTQHGGNRQQPPGESHGGTESIGISRRDRR